MFGKKIERSPEEGKGSKIQIERLRSTTRQQTLQLKMKDVTIADSMDEISLSAELIRTALINGDMEGAERHLKRHKELIRESKAKMLSDTANRKQRQNNHIDGFCI